jgi:hypothetical protein
MAESLVAATSCSTVVAVFVAVAVSEALIRPILPCIYISFADYPI